MQSSIDDVSSSMTSLLRDANASRPDSEALTSTAGATRDANSAGARITS